LPRIATLPAAVRHRAPLAAALLGLALALAAPVRAQGPVAGDAGAPAAPPADPCTTGPQLYHDGKMDEARKAFLACLKQGGDKLEVLLPLTVMAVREGRQAESLDFGNRAVALAPDDPEARYWYGRALLRAGRENDAKQQWEAGLQLTFNHAGILEGLARLALKNGETAKAYNLLTQLQQQGVDAAWIHGLLAQISASKGLWGQALGHMEDAMARETPDVDQLVSASELSILAGKKDQAVEYCRRAVALSPCGRSYGALGEAFFANDDMDSALVWLRRAVGEHDAPPRARFNLANALEVAGLFDEAGAQFRAFLDEHPDDAMGHFNYGIHLEHASRPEEALDEVDKAIALDPTMLNAMVVKAQMLENLERWDEALAVVNNLQGKDKSAVKELATWEQRLRDERDGADANAASGKVHLLHMVLGTKELLAKVQEELAKGTDFAEVAVRFSTGPAAAKGGDIGWINPQEMAEPIKSAVEGLKVDEISPPVEAKGLFHLFKRIR